MLRKWLRWLGLWCMLVASVMGVTADLYIVDYYSEAPVGFAMFAVVLFFASSVVAVCALARSWFTPEVHQFFVRAFWLAWIVLGLGVLLTVGTAVLAGVVTC